MTVDGKNKKKQIESVIEGIWMDIDYASMSVSPLMCRVLVITLHFHWKCGVCSSVSLLYGFVDLWRFVSQRQGRSSNLIV